jgi:hypothetical protein
MGLMAEIQKKLTTAAMPAQTREYNRLIRNAAANVSWFSLLRFPLDRPRYSPMTWIIVPKNPVITGKRRIRSMDEYIPIILPATRKEARFHRAINKPVRNPNMMAYFLWFIS